MSRRLRPLARGARWAIVAKPDGLACHRSAMVRDRDTVARRARERFRAPIHLVHRLDRAATGCLLLAFDPEQVAPLQDAMRAPSAEKVYLAFVRGWWRWDDPFLIDEPMSDDRGRAPQPAQTWVRALARCATTRASLIEARPVTGRYHQIRRHLRRLDHPILGDSAHGDTRVNRHWREEHGLTRLALHCASLRLVLSQGPVISATCPVPDDLHRLWSAQPWWHDARAQHRLLQRPPVRLHRTG